jgi:hypothetical protein
MFSTSVIGRASQQGLVSLVDFLRGHYIMELLFKIGFRENKVPSARNGVSRTAGSNGLLAQTALNLVAIKIVETEFWVSPSVTFKWRVFAERITCV